MTMAFDTKKICGICGAKSTHTDIMSSHSIGYSDLDTRPAPDARRLVHLYIQHCPTCGYCGYDISEPIDNVKEIIKSEEYKNIFKKKKLPKEAVHYLASSYIQQESKCFSHSAWDAIRAAWICDDKQKISRAEECRMKALELIEKADERGQQIAEEEGASEAITIDLMRRAGLFISALKLVEKAKEIDIGETLEKIIAFQKQLIMAEDKSCYTIGDALGDKKE